MAITINQQPPNISPVYNPMICVVLSDNRTRDKFRYIFQIVVGSTTITVRQSPNPDGYGVLDIHRMLEDYVTYDFSDATLFEVNSGSFVKYDIKFGEEYASSPTADSADHLNLTSITNNYAWNAALEFLEKNNFNVAHYEINNALSKYLTNAPRIQDIGIAQEGYLYFISNTNSKAKRMKVTVYYADGSNIVTFIDNPNYLPTADQYFLRFSIGTGSLGAYGIDFTDALRYTIQMVDSGSAASSEMFTYNIDDLCTKYKVYRIHFLNKLGGFDAFNFILRDTLNTEITRTTLEKIVGNFVAPAYVYDSTNHGTIQDNTVVKDTIQVNSNWATNEQAIWLKELFTSPAVYLEDTTLNPLTTFVPIVIADTKYQTKKSVPGEKLFNIILNFSFSVQNARQRF